MSVIAVKTVIYLALVGLLQAAPAVYDPTGKATALVRPGNLVRLDQPVANPPKLGMNTNAGDYPQLILGYGPWRFQGDSYTPRYGDQLGAKPAGRTKTLDLGFRLVLTHRDLQAVIDDALEVAAIDAIQSAGPTLGVPRNVLPFVQLGDVTAQTADVIGLAVTRTMKGTQRAETTFIFSVLARWQQDPSPTQTV